MIWGYFIKKYSTVIKKLKTGTYRLESISVNTESPYDEIEINSDNCYWKYLISYEISIKHIYHIMSNYVSRFDVQYLK